MMKQAKPRPVQASTHKATALDLSTVPTKAPPETPSAHPPTRIFGLEDAPCYYPTAEEFMEPLKFIESIRPEAEKAGICKIIPPEGWKPSFALDTEVFRFKTRIQKLNSMEGETRTNLNYLEQLYKFHRQQGHPVHKIPQLDKRPIDLFRLKKEVTARGGYQKVTSGKKWAEIGRGLNYTRKQCTSLSNALKTAYVNIILPYEIYLSKQSKPTPSNHGSQPKREPSMESTASTHNDTTSSSAAASTSANIFPETRKSKRIKKDPVSYADSEPSSPSHSDRMSSEPAQTKREGSNVHSSSDICQLCHQENYLEKMLVCDGCELGYHTFCLTPPLQHVPKTDWYCAKCLVAGEDFGFEEGEEYSLSSFQQKCNNFKKNWFEKYGHTDGKVSEDVVEREFWRLVENAYETVEVEYGADLHSTQHGSGFPSLERHPNDKYASHPSNLNNMPVLPESLFCHIKSDISGMMVPWLYVGMCFSTFCWHNEDHYTYSINYMHWGETKTWYGIPASDAIKFEETMKLAVPELFEQQPDLLFQLVTMLSPERLVANGVKVLALDQRPGQFVITFPQAYHAGFNHGFNFAEAVNFAPPDWCQFGLECANRYRQHRKHPVFSHDELLITTALNDNSIATAQWLQHEMNELLEREMKQRQGVMNEHPAIRIVLEEVDRVEEEVQCMHCNAYTYLSQVGCRCTAKVVCHEHYSELCSCEESERFLRLRYSDEQLVEIAEGVIAAAATPNEWADKYRSIMKETRKPTLKLLRSLLAEAEKIPCSMKEAESLKKFVERANEWVESVSKVLVRKHHQGRRATDRSQGGSGKRLEDLQEMLHEAERLRFDCPEIKQLQESIKLMHDFQLQAQKALDKPEHDLVECRELYEAGLGMNIGMEEIDRLDAIVKDLSWSDRASTKGAHSQDFQAITSLVTEAEKCGVSNSNPLLLELLRKQREGQQWEEKAQSVLAQGSVDMDELRLVIESGKQRAVPKALLSKAENLYNKVTEWQKTAEQLLARSKDPRYEERSPVAELKRAVKIAENIPTTLAHKQALIDAASAFDEWLNEAQQLLMTSGTKKPALSTLEDTLEDMKQNVEACTAVEAPLDPDRAVPELSKAAMDNRNGVPGPNSGAMDIDSGMDIERDDQVYCICRKAEAGMMVECDECHEWYHGPCIRMTKREASSKSNYICLVCNLGLIIRRDKQRPTLDQLTTCLRTGQCLGYFTPEVPLLEAIVGPVTQFRGRVDRFLAQDTIATSDILKVKSFLRKVEGLDVELLAERNALRAVILRLCPSSMPTPGVMLSDLPTSPPLSAIELHCLCVPTRVPAQDDGRLLILCPGCQDWYHAECVGLSVEQAQKLNKFSCPVCCVGKKKGYHLGTVQFTSEVNARAVQRAQAAKDQADAKKKRRKSKDVGDLAGQENGPPAKRAPKRKEPWRPKFHKEDPEPNSSMDPPNGNFAQPSSTTLPPFKESFLLPHERQSRLASTQPVPVLQDMALVAHVRSTAAQLGLESHPPNPYSQHPHSSQHQHQHLHNSSQAAHHAQHPHPHYALPPQRSPVQSMPPASQHPYPMPPRHTPLPPMQSNHGVQLAPIHNQAPYERHETQSFGGHQFIPLRDARHGGPPATHGSESNHFGRPHPNHSHHPTMSPSRSHALPAVSRPYANYNGQGHPSPGTTKGQGHGHSHGHGHGPSVIAVSTTSAVGTPSLMESNGSEGETETDDESLPVAV